MGKLSWMSAVAGYLLTGLCVSSLVAQDKISPQTLAVKIDQRLEEKWRAVQSAPRADDAEFLRRIYLDLAGRIPRVQEVRDFLEDAAPNRRERVVEHLLDSPQYVNHFSATLRNLLLPTNANAQGQVAGFKSWLEEQVRDNAPYDKMVRDILTVPLANNFFEVDQGSDFVAAPMPGRSPAGFFLANERKPENLAASTARIFMGVKLECAQCHDHPHARWSRAQFWEMAAFFPTMQVVKQPDPQAKIVPQFALVKPRQIRIAGTDKVVSAKFLTGKEPVWTDGVEPRVILAQWLTAADNPFFARTAANRVLAHFFGVGLIDPVDDEPTEENPVSHPELLAELSRQFVAHDHDLKYLIRAITLSKAYQRTSTQTHASQAEPRAFARMAVRGLTAEQLFDSIALATGFRETMSNPVPRPDDPYGINSARADFLNRFAGQERATEKPTSILQALALMNGKFVADATSLEKSTTLAAVGDAPFMTSRQKIETLYLAALSRLPRPEETQRLVAYVESGGPRGQPRQALGDIFWALLNSSEFVLNH